MIYASSILIGGALGYFIFYPGVFFKHPDQLSMLTIFTLPGGLILGVIVGGILCRRYTKKANKENNNFQHGK